MDDNFDVLVIGSGPGGYVTAIRASQLGLKTAIAEEHHLGGICLNWGCIPTKAILKSAEILNYLKHAEEYGLSAKTISFDLKKIVRRSRKISQQLSNGVSYLLKKNKVSILNGHARFSSDGRIHIQKDNKQTLNVTAKHKIIATGARPILIQGLEADDSFIWTYFEALKSENLPKSILIIGAGAIGIEFASLFRTLGSNVTVVEMCDHILPNEDLEISKMAREKLESFGIKFHTSTQISKCVKQSDHVECFLERKSQQSKRIKVEKVLSAIGVTGNIEDLGLETLHVKTKNGHILTDEFGRTNEPSIYAIGDVAGPPWLAHKAEHEGIVCIEKIVGENPTPISKLKIPGCTYCNPQIASVGLTETLAIEQGYKIKIGRFPVMANGKAIASGEDHGMVKTIFDTDTGQLLGAHMIGPNVTELIHGFVIAIGLETTEEDLINTVFPHPTLSEMLHESVLDAYNRAIHI